MRSIYKRSMRFPHQIGRASPGLDKEILMKGVNDTNVQAYLQFMIDVAVMLGANRTSAQDEMTDVLEFEESLVKVRINTSQFCFDFANQFCIQSFFRFHSSNIIQSTQLARLKKLIRN